MTTNPSDAPAEDDWDDDPPGFEKRLAEVQEELLAEELQLLLMVLQEQNDLLRQKLALMDMEIPLLQQQHTLLQQQNASLTGQHPAANQTTPQATAQTTLQPAPVTGTETGLAVTNQTTPSVPTQTPRVETDLEKSRRRRAEKEAETKRRLAEAKQRQPLERARAEKERNEKADAQRICLEKFKVAAGTSIGFDNHIYTHTSDGKEPDEALIAYLWKQGKKPKQLISSMVNAAAGGSAEIRFSQPENMSSNTYCHFTIDLYPGGFIGGKVTKAGKIVVRHLGPGSKY